MATHAEIERRSIALHRAVADKIRANPELIETARQNIRRWQKQGSRALPYLKRWEDLLNEPLPDLLERLVRDDEEMRALRQSTPFCGILTPRERWRIYETYRS